MVKTGIKIYLRVKPTKNAKKLGQTEVSEDSVTFHVPKEDSDGYINNKKNMYKFQFDNVFDDKTQQDVIFDRVCQNASESALNGYNSTVFAYGQTGSGKTFTITGGAERYKDRGMIPRSIGHLFQLFEKNPSSVYTMHISYLEIYNEGGFDLLDPAKEVSRLEDLPRVHLQEDSDGNFHTRNLSVHQTNTEEDALNLLFMGDTNRMIAETPMNMASTRSHCIFTIYISCRESGSATIRRGKLHLVDLAGSERVSKTGVSGNILTEAKYINLSLHYLEQVIIALSEKSRTHIPYRNSMMTSMLRDSLGGNCLTSMVATVALEKRNIDESISTCRFAQRVALIKNDAVCNEEVDPKLVINRLKKEIQNLKDDIVMSGQEPNADALTDDELLACREKVNKFIESSDPEEQMDMGADMRKIHFCNQYFKHLLTTASTANKTSPTSPTSETGSEIISPVINDKEIKRLKELVGQRDNEINILVNLLKKEKARQPSHDRQEVVVSPPPLRGTSQPSRVQKNLSQGRQEAFDIFRRDYLHNKAIEQNKSELKLRMKEAKQLGSHVNKSREKINSLKGSIEQRRVSLAVQGLTTSNESGASEDPREEELKGEIEKEKESYKQSFSRLKELKTEIEHLQHLLEQQRVRLQRDFEQWFAEQAANLQSSKKAWQTPSPRHNTLASIKSDHSKGGYPSNNSNSQDIDQMRSRHDLPSPPHSTRQPHWSAPPVQSNTSSITNKNSQSGMKLTGDKSVDTDIMAFMRAREALIQKNPK